MRALRQLADENDALLIFDEVQSGVGLTGRFWAHQHTDVKPDLLAFGKKMQVCGMLAGPRIDEEPENVFKVSSRLNSTWGGNLVDMVRSQRYLEIIERGRPGARTRRRWARTCWPASRRCRRGGPTSSRTPAAGA